MAGSHSTAAPLLPLGVGAGLPYFLVGTTLSAWLTTAGVDLGTVGLLSLCGLPYSLKVLWAPLCDRYRLPWLGRRRGWLLLCQIAVAVGLVLMGAAGPAPGYLVPLALLTAVLSASQDIVLDAYRADALPAASRAAGTSAYLIGYRLGMLAAGTGALLLAKSLPWSAIYALLGGGMAVGLLGTLWAREPPAAAAPASLGAAIAAPLRELRGRQGLAVVLGVVLLYRLGDVASQGMIVPFLLRRGFSTAQVGTLHSGLNVAAIIAGTVVAPRIMGLLGLRRALLLFGVLQAAANCGYVILGLPWGGTWLLVATTVADGLCNAVGTVALVTWLTALCHPAYSATQYALLSGVSGAAARLLGAGAGHAAAWLGWPLFFAASIAVAMPGLLLLSLLPASGPLAPAAATGDLRQ